jgi:hypothetical protein
MGISVRQRADIVGTYRHLGVALMETLARWVPTTPELEVKTLFGRHIWDLAQHADALGRRAPDLRAPLHNDLPPVAAYATLLDELAGADQTAQRVSGFYDALLPDLARRYERYLGTTDALLDEPTVRILERVMRDYGRLRDDLAAVRAERADLALHDAGYAQRIAQQAAAVAEITAFRPAAAPAAAR